MDSGGGCARSATAPKYADNENGSDPLEFRYKLTWTTHKDQPLGNNGRHILSATSQIKFRHKDGGQWQDPEDGGPGAVTTNVRNLYAAGVTGDRGTIDYFKWDPDSTDAALRQPKLRFTIKDTQYHKYQWIMRFRQTVGSGTWNWDSGWWSQKGEVVGAGPHEIDLSLSTRTGHLDADTHPWGTYTYDILFLEYEGETPPEVQAAALDWNFVKRYKNGYKLWVPEFLPAPNGDEPGHSVWLSLQGDLPGLRAYYCLHSEEAMDPLSVTLTTLDPMLCERAALSGPTERDAGHGVTDADGDGRFDGLECYRLASSDPGGIWRVIFTAMDSAGRSSPDWRTHDLVPMLAVNERPPIRDIIYITGTYGTPARRWRGAMYLPSIAGFASRAQKFTQFIGDPNRRTPYQYVHDLVVYNKARSVEAVTNGGFFADDIIGDLGVGAKGQWQKGTDYQGAPARWAFGMVDSHFNLPSIQRSGSLRVPPSVEAGCEYGRSGIGCICKSGSWKSPEDQGGWPDPEGKRARTAIGWSNLWTYFFQIVVEEPTYGQTGWTWDETVQFFRTELPAHLRREFGLSTEIWDAMMLDGGGSTGIRYRAVERDVVVEDEYWQQPDPQRRAPVPDVVHGRTNG